MDNSDTKMSKLTTLAGFSSMFDRRPLEFKEPQPRLPWCHLCGVTPNVVKMLTCCHAFCGTCYMQILARFPSRCPLDDIHIAEDGVQTLVIQECHLELKVGHCPNTDKGCTYVGSVQALEGHFQKECLFHELTCSRCGSLVLQSKFLDHHLNSCISTMKHLNTEPTLELTLDSVRQVKRDTVAALEDMTSKNAALNDRINSLLECVKDYACSVKGVEDHLGRCVQACRLFDAVESCGGSADRGVVFLGEMVAKRASCTAPRVGASSLLTVAGYGVKVVKSFKANDPNFLFLSLKICSGPWDAVLNWPIKKELSLCLVHPSDSKKNIRTVMKKSGDCNEECYRKPEQGRETCCPYWQWYKVDELKDEGFFFNDAILVAVEAV